MTVQVDRSLRLPDGEYFAERERKTGIAIHHTVCGAAQTTIELWRDGRLVDELCGRFPIPRRYPDRPFDYCPSEMPSSGFSVHIPS
jgi:hypothetical protein